MTTPAPQQAASQPAKPAAKKTAAKAPAPHHLQFQLVDEAFKPITEPRRYTLKWTDQGSKTAQTREGSSDADGKTERVETQGAVPVTLSIAPPEGADCQIVGSVASRAMDRKPLVKAQLMFAGQAVSATKPSNACVQLTVREGLQQVQYVLNNVPQFVTEDGHTYPNYLNNLPYYIVNADTLEILTDMAAAPKLAPLMTGTKLQVMTAKVNVDGVARVGLVLGAATDDPSRWDRDTPMYVVTPKERGLTQVVINDVAEIGTAEDCKVRNYESKLNGYAWAERLNPAFTMADVRRIVPGGVTVDTRKPNDLQLDYAVSKGYIDAAAAAAYKAARQGKPGTGPGPLRYVCSWAELLEPLYTGRIEGAEPPNPVRKVPVVDPKTKKQAVDPSTKKPLTVEEPIYTKTKYDDLKHRGDGTIVIAPLGLTLELAGRLTNGAEPACENAHTVTGKTKAEVIARTHPLTYVLLLDACREVGVSYVLIGCTWRPMIGSVFHKLGDALDVLRIDSDQDAAPAFRFFNVHVDNLADRFTRTLAGHRYGRAEATYYNFDNLPANAPFHHNHLHITANRLATVQPQDMVLPTLAPAAAPKGVTQ